MARQWRVAICPLAAGLVLVGLVSILAAPGTAAETEVVVVCREPGLPIPDADDSGAVDTITFGDDLTVVSATVAVTLTNVWLGDLVVTLEKAGDGPAVTLLDRLGVWEGNTDGCGAEELAALFADGAPEAATESCEPVRVSGELRPATPLALLAGRRLAGSWQLKVVDRAAGWTGRLERWCLRVEAAPAPQLVVTPAALDAWVAPGMTRTVTVTLANQGAAEWRWGEAPAAAGGELLLVEDFEDDHLPPPGWEAVPATGWQRVSGMGHNGTQAALVPWADGAQDVRLNSPPLSLQRGWLTMWTWGSASICGDTERCDLEVYLLGEDGDPLLLGRADDEWPADHSWTAHAWELTPHLPEEGSVRIVIRYVAEPQSAPVLIDDVHVSGLARPADCNEPPASWLASMPPVAPAPPGGQSALTVLLDARALPPASYSSTLCLPGNDPRAPLWPLPVTLNVDGCAAIPPPAPDLTIEEGPGGSALLSWTPKAGQAAYRLYRGSRPYEETLWRELSAGARTAVDAAPGSAAFYRLEAANCSGAYWAGSGRVGWLVYSLEQVTGQSGSVAPPAGLQAPAGTRWHAVTVALDTGGRLARASDLLAAIPGSRRVMRWSAPDQKFAVYAPADPATDFALQLGDPLFVLLDEQAGPTFTLVGDVPEPGQVGFEMVGGAPCRWHHISLPLEQGAVRDTQALAEAIRGPDERAVEQLLQWDAAIQNFVYWVPAPLGGDGGLGTSFATSIGHDHFVCLNREVTWP